MMTAFGPVGLAALVLACCRPLSAAGFTRDFALDSLQTVACRVQDGRVVLGEWFDAGDATTLAMEAEDALDLVADPPQGVEDAACSGGRYVAKVDRALFPFRVNRPGRYCRWSLGFFPQGGGWVHSESLDGGDPVWVTDCDGSTAGRWVWVKGPVYDLRPGVHLLWIHNWHGGARLDKVVLAPEGAPAPQDLGPASTRRSAASEGSVLTPVLAIPGLAKLTEVRWPHEAGSGEVRVSLSADGGRSFVPLDQAPTLSFGSAVPRIQLRADMRAAANGARPTLGVPGISYAVDPNAFATLENERVRATFLKATGALAGLYDKAARADCLAGGDSGSPPFELRQLPKGATTPQPVPASTIRLTSLDAKGTSLTAKYRVGDGLAAVLAVTLSGSELAWSLEVDNQSALDLVEVACPVLPGVRLGDRSADDFLMTPNWQGGIETADPVRAGGDHVPYPCGGSMAWFDLYEKTPAHGVYLSSHDPSLLGCHLVAAPDTGAGTLTLSLTRYAHVRPGARWTSPPAVIGLHAGDWHTAADAYRAWAGTWMQRPQPPEWVREADGWFGLVTSANGSRIPFRQVPEFLKPMRELGTNYIQVWGQMTAGENCDALPYPNPALGSVDEFKAAIREVQRWGGHITFYVSSQFWRVDYGDAPTLGTTLRSMLPSSVPTWNWNEWRDYAIRGYDGSFSGDSPLSEADRAMYGTPWTRTVMCPFTDTWANRHLLYWCVSQYGANYGANGIYLDETSAASERICFAQNHGHEHPGIWGASLMRDMKSMVSEGRRRDPDWMFAMEGCNDAIGQYADVNLISPASARKDGLWGATRRFAPEVFHYTFPDYILYNGVANGLYQKSEDDCLLDAHVLGNRYDVFSAQPAGRYVALRQWTKQLLYRARFMDTIGVESSDPAVRAKINVLQDLQNDVRLINLANPTGKPNVIVTVAMAKPEGATAYSFDLEGKDGVMPLRSAEGGAAFTAPTSRASTVIVAVHCEPLLRVPVTSVVAGESAPLRATLTNVTAHPVSGKLVVEGDFAGGKVPPVSASIPAGTSVEALIPLSVAATAPRRCLAGHVRFEGAGVTVRRPLEVLVTSPFETTAALRAGQVHLTVRNIGRSAQTGRVRVEGALWAEAVTLPLSVAGTGKGEFDLPPPSAGAALDEPVQLDVAIECGGQTDRQTLGLRPVVLNGGFERAGQGGRPGDWQYQQPQQAASDAANPAAGKVCLRLDGKPGLFVEADQLLAVEAGRTYEARCRMRRTAGDAPAVGPAVVLFLKAGGERYEHLKKVTNLPDDQWNDYAATFTVAADVARVAFYLYNVNSDVTAWYDEVRVE